MFLGDAGQESRNVDEGDDREVEAIAEADEPGALVRGVDIQTAGQNAGLVGHDADRHAVQPGETHHHVLGVHFLDLEEMVGRPRRRG